MQQCNERSDGKHAAVTIITCEEPKEQCKQTLRCQQMQAGARCETYSRRVSRTLKASSSFSSQVVHASLTGMTCSRSLIRRTSSTLSLLKRICISVLSCEQPFVKQHAGQHCIAKLNVQVPPAGICHAATAPGHHPLHLLGGSILFDLSLCSHLQHQDHEVFMLKPARKAESRGAATLKDFAEVFTPASQLEPAGWEPATIGGDKGNVP